MAENPFISVIIPIYRVEAFLIECVQSVVSQSFRDIEIILVDDGSPDHCPLLCDEFANKDRRIRAIHKSNGGLSDARNCGITYAGGEYVAFLDGDDFWDDDKALERLAARVKKTHADVVNFSYKKFDEISGKKKPYFHAVPDMPENASNKEAQLRYMTENRLLIASACNKLIKRDLLTDDLLFEKGVFSEDIEWSAKLIKKADSIDFVCENFYCYRRNSESISHTINSKKCQDATEHIKKCAEMADEADGMLRECLRHYTAYQLGTFFLLQAKADNRQDACIKELAGYKSLLRYHGGHKKLIVLSFLCKVVGFRGACRLTRAVFGSRKGGRA